MSGERLGAIMKFSTVRLSAQTSLRRRKMAKKSAAR